MSNQKNAAGKNQLAVVRKVNPPGGELGRPQLAALGQMMQGNSIAEAARNAGISRSTLYRWMTEDAEFQAAYNSWHEEAKECTRASLVATYDVAADNVRRGIERGDVGLSMKVLKGAGALEPEERRLTEAGEIKQRAELDRKKRQMEMAKEELELHSDVEAARQLKEGLEGKKKGAEKDGETEGEGEVVAKVTSYKGKLRKSVTKRATTTAFALSQKATGELIRMARASGGMRG